MLTFRRNALPTLTLCAAAAMAAPAMAQDFLGGNLIKPGTETFTIGLGGIVNTFDSGFRFNGQAQNGTEINLEDNGAKKTLSSFAANATWRFFPRHRIDAEYFQAKRSGTRNYSNSITIGDNVYPIGATVSAEMKDTFFLVDYRYSFMKTDNVEVAGLFGLYGARVDLSATATGNGTGTVRTASSSSSTTLPLPVIGGSVDWYITPRWKVAGVIEGLKANIADVDGSIFVGAVATEYTLWRNVGVGARYMYSDLSADVTKSSFNGSVSWRMNSFSLYAKVLF